MNSSCETTEEEDGEQICNGYNRTTIEARLRYDSDPIRERSIDIEEDGNSYHIVIALYLVNVFADCLDSGNNKKAIQEADKVLKKHPDSLCAKVLIR